MLTIVDAALLLTIGFGIFALCMGLAFFAKYLRFEREKLELGYTIQKDQQVQELAEQVEHYKRSAQNFQARLHRLSRSYDVDFEDDELPDAPNDQLVPAALELIGSKLPPSIKPILNNPKVVNSLVDVVVKNPDILNKVVGLFGKDEQQRPASVQNGI